MTEEHEISIDIPGIDAEKGLSLYDGDIKTYISVLRAYALYTPGLLHKLRDATVENLPDRVTTAHGVKGSSANICAEEVRDCALDMERAAASGNLEKYLALLGPCLENVDRLLKNINAWFEAYDKKFAKPRLKTPDREILIKLRQSCEVYDISGIYEAMEALESASYDTGADLAAWLRRKIDIMEIDEVIARLAEENI